MLLPGGARILTDAAIRSVGLPPHKGGGCGHAQRVSPDDPLSTVRCWDCASVCALSMLSCSPALPLTHAHAHRAGAVISGCDDVSLPVGGAFLIKRVHSVWLHFISAFRADSKNFVLHEILTYSSFLRPISVSGTKQFWFNWQKLWRFSWARRGGRTVATTDEMCRTVWESLMRWNPNITKKLKAHWARNKCSRYQDGTLSVQFFLPVWALQRFCRPSISGRRQSFCSHTLVLQLAKCFE